MRTASPSRDRIAVTPSWATAIIDPVVTLLLWSYFTIGFVMFFAPFYLLAAVASQERARAFQWLNHLFYRGFFGWCRIIMPLQQWRIDPALKSVRGAVVVCNHLSYIDPLLLISLFGRHTTIVKNRLFSIPIFGWMLGLSGYLPSASQGRLAQRMVERMEEMPGFLAGGGNLIVFPEGTRSRTGEIGELNAGAFKIARMCRAPLAVAAIGGSDRLFTPGRFRFNACQANTITVRLVTKLTPDYNSPNFSVKGLMGQVKELLAAAAAAGLGDD
ncbi:MAG: lysophospholipid acyltransferase family protein [Desulfobacteraceae bacterium]|nr:lysophospholipid acyltransferase family protein [Desulfobacteraceae bacterium]